jgi:hypothetical protein
VLSSKPMGNSKPSGARTSSLLKWCNGVPGGNFLAPPTGLTFTRRAPWVAFVAYLGVGWVACVCFFFCFFFLFPFFFPVLCGLVASPPWPATAGWRLFFGSLCNESSFHLCQKKKKKLNNGTSLHSKYN